MTTGDGALSPPVRALTKGASHFFGFHDLTPWNERTGELVCLRTETPEDHVPTSADVADVVTVDETTGRVERIGGTRAWNWQQGARQRWLPAVGRRVVAFNVESSSGFGCRIVDLASGSERMLPAPLYEVFDSGDFGLSLDFARLYRCQPGYGYDDGHAPGRSLERDTGIRRVSLSSARIDTIVTTEDVVRHLGLDASDGLHYLTHIQISPDGRRMAFIHRCFLRSGALVNNFLLATTQGTDLRLLVSDKVSHFDWIDDSRIIAWCRVNPVARRLKESRLMGLAKPLYRLSRRIRWNPVRQTLYNECFREFDVDEGTVVSVGKGVLEEDGHPQVHPHRKNIWIVDTYPDTTGHMSLILFDASRERRFDVTTIPTQMSIRETTWRCDLHPRWAPEGDRVCIDSAHGGRRQLCVVDVSSAVGLAQ